MTLVEIMVATGLGSIVLLVLGALTLYSARSFGSMINYTDLNKESRMALDRISKEIRRSRGLVARTPTSLVFESSDGTNKISYTYDPAKKEIIEESLGGSKILLKNCTFWTNEIFQRNPQAGSFDFISTANPAVCKMVQITWTCSSKAMESKKNTADVQSMKVVIRKKPD